MLAAFGVLWSTALFEDNVGEPSRRLNARVTGSILTTFGESVRVDGTRLHSDRTRLNIGEGCDALGPMAIFAIAIVSVPVAATPKLLGLALGLPLLWIVNLIRTVTLYYFSAYLPEWFEVMHLDVWQGLYILACAFIWVAWGSLVLRRSE